jgi:hypothetical protein
LPSGLQIAINWGFAGAISVLLLIVVLIVFVAYDRLLGLSTMTGAATMRNAVASRLRLWARSGLEHSIIALCGVCAGGGPCRSCRA